MTRFLGRECVTATSVYKSSSIRWTVGSAVCLALAVKFGEMDELLMEMIQAREGLLATKAAEKTAQRDQDKEKDRIGKGLVASATKRRASEFSSNSEGEETGPAPKKAKTKSFRVPPSMAMAAFSSNMRDAELARIELDRDGLQLERDRSETDRLERELEDEERREEREKNQELELEKYKLLIEVLNKK